MFGNPDKLLTGLLLTGIFGVGLWISFKGGAGWGASYIFLWLVSYPVIYAGTCRYCTYYGKKCPIPMEGSRVQHFFEPAPGPFGYRQLAWALIAYVMRAAVPVVVIFTHAIYLMGFGFVMLFAAFWINHLRFSGCPNCINTACPLNPGT
jgi:hypothetical protein